MPGAIARPAQMRGLLASSWKKFMPLLIGISVGIPAIFWFAYAVPKHRKYDEYFT